MTTRAPSRRLRHTETHASGRAQWLRAAVLGADDAIVSTASLMIGVAATHASPHAVLVAGVAGLVAGAMSMAAGEYVSVSSQRDAELADIERERQELAEEPDAELRELAGIYVKRGLDAELAMKVAQQLSSHDRLGAHLRDELGVDPSAMARPLQAAWASAVSFGAAALLPIAAMYVAPDSLRTPFTAGISLLALAAAGALGARLGGAPIARAAVRVALGGSLAMLATFAIGRLLDVAIH